MSDVFKTKEEAENYINPWIDKVSADLGCSIERYAYDFDGRGNNPSYWSAGARLKFLNYQLGNIVVDYGYHWDEETRNYVYSDPYVKFNLDTKVTFTMKSTFTKSNMRHDVDIKLNVTRIMYEKDYKKFIDWAKLIMKQLKTAEAKKRKFQADVDFE